jgi:geranylgeranyl transferase type-2 subunit beta
MTSLYLQALDDLLRAGLAPVSRGFRAAQADFVRARQLPEGGWPGRQGPADPYYTDFALRVLTAGEGADAALAAAAAYLRDLPAAPRDLVDCFSRLNAVRLLEAAGLAPTVDREAVRAVVLRQAVDGGGFGRPGGGVSAYQTFLGALCCELLGLELPEAAGARERVRGLACAQGGFSDLAGETSGQTSTTAAAVGFLGLREALTAEEARGAADLLARAQAVDGGFRAHPGAPESDLLSTFTGLLTLAGLDGLDRVDLEAAGRFLKAVAAPQGGFRGTPRDSEADVEYTYYGLGVMALLQTAAAGGETEGR